VVATLSYFQRRLIAITNCPVDQPVFLDYPARVPTAPCVSQLFRHPRPFKRTIGLNAFHELIDSLAAVIIPSLVVR
jgi:hypothetical protein